MEECLRPPKRRSADFPFGILGVWVGTFESQRRQFILEIGYNFIKKVKIRHIFVIIRPCRFKVVEIDLALHRRLLHSVYSIRCRYQFVVYHTIAQLQVLTSRITGHKLVVHQQYCFKIINTTNGKIDIFFANNQIVICINIR